MENEKTKCEDGCGLDKPENNATKELKRPDGVTDEHLKYLDGLRESGRTNMFGAGAYVESRFFLSRAEARKIVLYWMETFDNPAR